MFFLSENFFYFCCQLRKNILVWCHIFALLLMSEAHSDIEHSRIEYLLLALEFFQVRVVVRHKTSNQLLTIAVILLLCSKDSYRDVCIVKM